MNRLGKVIDIEEGKAIIKVERHSSCSNCKSCKIGTDDIYLKENISKENLEIGDNVEISMENQNIFLGATIAYIIPLLSLVLGILVTYFFLKVFNLESSLDELFMVVVGIVFMIFSYIIISKNNDKMEQSNKFSPVIKKI